MSVRPSRLPGNSIAPSHYLPGKPLLPEFPDRSARTPRLAKICQVWHAVADARKKTRIPFREAWRNGDATGFFSPAFANKEPETAECRGSRDDASPFPEPGADPSQRKAARRGSVPEQIPPNGPARRLGPDAGGQSFPAPGRPSIPGTDQSRASPSRTPRGPVGELGGKWLIMADIVASDADERRDRTDPGNPSVRSALAYEGRGAGAPGECLALRRQARPLDVSEKARPPRASRSRLRGGLCVFSGRVPIKNRSRAIPSGRPAEGGAEAPPGAAGAGFVAGAGRMAGRLESGGITSRTVTGVPASGSGLPGTGRFSGAVVGGVLAACEGGAAPGAGVRAGSPPVRERVWERAGRRVSRRGRRARPACPMLPVYPLAPSAPKEPAAYSPKASGSKASRIPRRVAPESGLLERAASGRGTGHERRRRRTMREVPRWPRSARTAREPHRIPCPVLPWPLPNTSQGPATGNHHPYRNGATHHTRRQEGSRKRETLPQHDRYPFREVAGRRFRPRARATPRGPTHCLVKSATQTTQSPFLAPYCAKLRGQLALNGSMIGRASIRR